MQFNNGLYKLIYHDTSMIIPLANAIFDGEINIDDFYQNIEKERRLNIENFVIPKS